MMTPSFTPLQVNLQARFLTDANVPLRIGLVALASDMVLEVEWRDLFANTDIELFVARVPCDPMVDPARLATMEDHISACAELILPGVPLDAMAYGCTSASMVIGENKVARLLRREHTHMPVTNPFTAVKAVLRHLQARRIVVLSPYITMVNQPFYEQLTAAGFEVVIWGAMQLQYDRDVGSIDTHCLPELVAQLLASVRQPVDAVFMSCTNLRAIRLFSALEERFGCPFLSSNSAMAWHLLQLLDRRLDKPGFGQLLAGSPS